MILDFLRKVFKRDKELDIDLELERSPPLENASNFREPPSQSNFSSDSQQTFTNTQQFLQPAAYLPPIQSQQNTQDIELLKQQIMVLTSKIEALNSKIDILLQKIQMLEQFLYYRR